MTEKPLDLRSAVAQIENIERQAPARTRREESLCGRLALLQAWLMPTAGLRRETLERILLYDANEETRWRASLDLAQMPDSRIRRLRREDRYNRLAALANYFAELATGVASGNVQRILRLGLDGFFVAEPLSRLTPRNRQALSIYDRWGDAQPPPAPKTRDDLRPYVERIRRRRERERARELIVRGRWGLRNGFADEARQAFALCREIDPENSEARAKALEAARAVSSELRLRQASNRTEPEPALPPAEEKERRRLLLCICRNDAQALAETAQRLQTNNADSPLAAQASYAAAILCDAETGKSAPESVEARAFLEEERNRSPHARRLWSLSNAFHEAPETNAAAAFAEARARHRTDMLQYVFWGDRSIPSEPDAGTPRTRAHRLIDSLSILLPFEWIVRGLHSRYGRPIEDAPWRDAAARYLAQARSGPRGLSPADSRIALDLADACVKIGYYNQARTWHALAAGEDAKYETRLDAKAARRMLRAARAQTDASRQREILEGIASRFPQTRSAAKARRLIEKADRAGPQRMRVSKADLAEWPALWLGRGLRLDPVWFDGETANGELTAQGVEIAKRPLAESVQYLLVYRDRKIDRRLTPTQAAAAEIREELAAFERETAARRRAASILDRPVFLLELEGSAGPSGMDLYPRLAPLPFEPEDLPLFRSPVDIGSAQ